MEFAKCSVCHEKDTTDAMLMPCRCDRWTHQICLDKKRIAEASHFDRCPLCGEHYKIDEHKITDTTRKLQIISAISRDVIFFIVLFLLSSSLSGKILVMANVELKYSPMISGVVLVSGVLLFISFIFGIISIARGKFIFLNGIDCRQKYAVVILVAIGAFVLAAATVYWIITTVTERFRSHVRRADVKTHIVLDFRQDLNA